MKKKVIAGLVGIGFIGGVVAALIYRERKNNEFIDDLFEGDDLDEDDPWDDYEEDEDLYEDEEDLYEEEPEDSERGFEESENEGQHSGGVPNFQPNEGEGSAVKTVSSEEYEAAKAEEADRGEEELRDTAESESVWDNVESEGVSAEGFSSSLNESLAHAAEGSKELGKAALGILRAGYNAAKSVVKNI